MCEAPGSVVTLLCSGIQLYSAERRIADCILADVKRASMCTSAELARLSCSSEATITRLCHKLGFENYRKFQLALARDAMEQQEAQRMRDEGQDELHQALLNILANREEELRATIQAIDTRQLRQILSLLRIFLLQAMHWVLDCFCRYATRVENRIVKLRWIGQAKRLGSEVRVCGRYCLPWNGLLFISRHGGAYAIR